MCTAHPSKGDLKTFDGLTAEEEDYHEKCALAQMSAILSADKAKSKYFSKELLHLADPHFVASPPPSPAWKRCAKKKAKQPAPRQAPPQEESSEEEQEIEPRSLADLASFWSEEVEDGSNH